MKKNILLIGVGGTGSNAVDTFFSKLNEFKNQTDNNVTALVFDTDAGDLKKIKSAKTVAMSDPASVGTICDRIGKEYLKEWFPWDAKDVRAQEMVRGASQWRKKSYLAFLNLMNKPIARKTFISALEDMVKDPGASCEVYVIASVAGGTGSGSFIPIALYAKRYLRKALGKNPIVNAMIALPDIYAESQTPENRIKVYSNAYAILRELNAINLVSRNYNAGLTAKKKAPVRFRIGHPDEPNVGVLFDASDKSYWTPEAAPFSQIFLLDRIPRLNSIQAHDMVLANSLYTIICTEIGAAFDSEFSNHELVRSQNNGSNAIYAGVSTSQIRFPKDTILDYLAYKKTLESCEGEWLTIHKSVETAIAEKEREAKAAKRRFVMKDDAYANMVLEAVNNKLNENNDDVTAIYERCVEAYTKEGKRSPRNAAQLYLSMIDTYINSKIPDIESAKTTIIDNFPKDDDLKSKSKEDFTSFVQDDVYPEVLNYFIECFDAVKCVPTSVADAAITLNKKKVGTIGDQYSLVRNLLQTSNGTYIHPVAALIRLCQLRVALSELPDKEPEWPELKKRTILELPDRFFEISGEVSSRKSGYVNLGTKRFEEMVTDPDKYESEKSKVTADFEALREDIEPLLMGIQSSTISQINSKTYANITRDVDLLIAKFRSFFSRFEKEKENLVEETLDVYRKDAGTIDSVINVYSTKENKDAIKAIVDDSNGPMTDADVAANDNITGKGVLDSVMQSAIAEFSHDEEFNDNDSSAYRNLFNGMVDASREFIVRSDSYKSIASLNTIEAIVKSCGSYATAKDIDDAIRNAFTVAQDVAIPSLKLENNLAESDLVQPSNVMVFMMSLNTAKYIKKNAEKFGIHLPADQSNEGAILRSCAEQFIRDYSGNSGARVTIVKSIPDQILYCTGEIMDITPLCIAKFNELGEDCSYFKNYTDALRRYNKYETDMWNPHLGNDLHKRGYLPYMNAEMENICDEKMIKALLYALENKLITYSNGIGVASKQYFFVNGPTKILDDKFNPINNKNISQLLAWLRNEDEKIEDWSAKFDNVINEQMLALPTIVSETEIPTLEGALTKSHFMSILNGILYTDPTEDGKRIYKKGGGYVADTKLGPTAIEFAHIIRTCEEIGRDCDDAERIIKVLYKTFLQLIEYRAPMDSSPDRFITIYKQQLNNFYEALACIETIYKSGENCDKYYRTIVDWLNQNGLFMDISINAPKDQFGNLAINVPYDYKANNNISKIFEAIKASYRNPNTTTFIPADDSVEE